MQVGRATGLNDMPLSRIIRVSATAAFVAVLAASLPSSAGTPDSEGEPIAAFVDVELIASCGPAPAGADNKGKRDYRLRESSEDSANDFRDFQKYHVDRVVRNMAPGGNKGDIASNFLFVLRRSPNHVPMLELMTQWKLAGGVDSKFPAPKCFFAWAAEFVPDDVSVWQRGGYFFWKTGDQTRAESWWLEALRVDPASADSHYNLGLLYVGRKDYVKALEHAWSAYQAGFPLPGLRRQLEQAGQWQSPPPATDD
jgi:hypothetical protein